MIFVNFVDSQSFSSFSRCQTVRFAALDPALPSICSTFGPTPEIAPLPRDGRRFTTARAN